MNLCGLENRRHTKNDRLRVPTLEAKPQLANKYKFNAHEKYPYTHTTRLKNVAKKKRKSLLICASLLLGIPRNSDGAPPGPLDIQALPFPPPLLPSLF